MAFPFPEQTRQEILGDMNATDENTPPAASTVASDPMMARAREVLRQVFGYDDFRLQQANIIETLAHGHDALALMPTGGGKSLCYQIPALIRPGTGIVVSPLIALMQDQVAALHQLGLRAAFLNSTLSYREVRQVETALVDGALDLLYVAPERLMMDSTLALLERTQLALFAIDEAHCVSQWGHDFRPEYKKLSVLHTRFPKVPRIALTATADSRTRQEIISELALEDARQFVSSFDRPNIRYIIQESDNQRAALWRFLQKEHPEDAGIVYCMSRKKTEEIAQWLSEQGRTALPYHAGLSVTQRQQHQDRFLREDGIIIVATIAFGMGIDKPDVRFVAHLNLPKNIEAYYQETGRAGRDGAPATAWMSYGMRDVILLRQMVEESPGSEQYKRIMFAKLDKLLGLCDMTGCRRQALLAYFDEELAEPCGNCDNCLNPPETFDATVAAQKALSCVYRTGQRFGVNYVIDVLLGKEDDRISRFRHDRLSTYGIGRDIPRPEWRHIFRQLVVQGFLAADVEGHGGLHLTEKARPLLRGELSLHLRKRKIALAERPRKRTTRPAELRERDQALFDALKALRLRLAREQNVPPYVIFHDRALIELATLRPKTLSDMRLVNGIGEKKVAVYGDAFLAEIAKFARPPASR